MPCHILSIIMRVYCILQVMLYMSIQMIMGLLIKQISRRPIRLQDVKFPASSMTIGSQMSVRLSAFNAGCPYPTPQEDS
jgi:hypothetical protein